MTKSSVEDTRQQKDVIAFLSNPTTFGGETPTRVDTHGSVVFLAGDRAFKLKRAVRYPYLDYSTRALRRAACEAELAVNRAIAPDLYLGVIAVTDEGAGTLALGGQGAPRDWLVVMRRFDQTQSFDHMAERGALSEELIAATADAIVAFQRTAAVRTDAAQSASLAELVAENAAILLHNPVFDARAVRALNVAAADAARSLGPLLDRRRAEGLVRRGHGDLHLRNLCLFRGQPTLFDAIEFDERLATVDVLYEIAFLLMDLWHRGLRTHANRLLTRYVELTQDIDGLAALPLFLSTRAAIRAHVSVAAAERAPDDSATLKEEARAYLSLARELLKPGQPRLVALGGLSGTGKTTQARMLAPLIGRPPGAVVLRSDAVRKALMGVPETTRLGPEGYTSEITGRVYAAIAAVAERTLKNGQAAIIDAVAARPSERAAFARAAANTGAPFTGIWLEAPLAAREARVTARLGDASDADVAIVRQQEDLDVGALEWIRVSAAGTPEEVHGRVVAAVLAPR